MNTEQVDLPQAAPQDAIQQLVADHRKVKRLFDQFEDMKDAASDQEKGALVEKICNELTVHEAVENDVFFPAVREVLRKKDVLDEAAVEQEDAGDAIQALSELTPGDRGYDEDVADLGAQIAAHAAEEEKDLFPKVQVSEIDTQKLGVQMSTHKAQLKKNPDR